MADWRELCVFGRHSDPGVFEHAFLQPSLSWNSYWSGLRFGWQPSVWDRAALGKFVCGLRAAPFWRLTERLLCRASRRQHLSERRLFWRVDALAESEPQSGLPEN